MAADLFRLTDTALVAGSAFSRGDVFGAMRAALCAAKQASDNEALAQSLANAASRASGAARSAVSFAAKNSSAAAEGASAAADGALWAAKRNPTFTAAVVGAVAVPVAAPIVISAPGFGSAGVAVGSLAAWAQGTFYGGAVASGSVFATLQSIGAAGFSVVGVSGLVAGGASVGAAGAQLLSGGPAEANSETHAASPAPSGPADGDQADNGASVSDTTNTPQPDSGAAARPSAV